MSFDETDRKRKAAAELPLQQQPSPPKFTVTYSRLCDGGMQEMSTAVTCVRDIFPNATIRTNRRNPQEDMNAGLNPAVVISLESNSSSSDGNINATSGATSGATTGEEHEPKTTTGGAMLWSAKQQNLYEKFPKKRRRSVNNLRKSLTAFKTSLLESTTTETVSASDADGTIERKDPPKESVDEDDDETNRNECRQTADPERGPAAGTKEDTDN